MVDVPTRMFLKAALADLVEGRITNNQFAHLTDERCAESPDRGVAAIYEFGDSLYTDAMTYRLTGRYAIDAETRKTAERCLRFLRTAENYSWPDYPSMAAQCAAGGIAVFLMVPFGVVLLIAAWFFWTVSLLLAGFLVLGVSWFLWWWSRSQDTPELQEYWAHGDRDAWPFLHRTDEVQPCVVEELGLEVGFEKHPTCETDGP